MLKFKPIGQTLHRTDTFGVVADSVEYLKVEFDFSSSDFGGITTAVFSPFYNNGINYEVVLDDNNSCIVPEEVIKHRGFIISIYSVIGNKKITSNKFSVPVAESGYAKGETPKDPTPTVYEQLLEIVNNTKSIAKSVRDDADNGAFNGENGADGVGVSKAEISADGVLSITLSNGKEIKLGNVKGEKGDNGINGTNGLDGIGITNATINPNGELVLSFSDGNNINLGNVKGAEGEQGTKGDKGEQGIQGLPGANGKDGVDGKNATINGKNVINILAGDNINLEENGENIKISASCVMKPLSLSTDANSPTLLSNIGEGAFITINTGYIKTSGGFQKAIGKGAELVIVNTLKDDIAQLCVTVQTGSSVLFFWDKMSADMRNEIFISTLSVKNDLNSLTDRNVMSGTFAKTMFEERIKKSEVGNGLKFADGKLQLDIPVATAETGYGG